MKKLLLCSALAMGLCGMASAAPGGKYDYLNHRWEYIFNADGKGVIYVRDGFNHVSTANFWFYDENGNKVFHLKCSELYPGKLACDYTDRFYDHLK